MFVKLDLSATYETTKVVIYLFLIYRRYSNLYIRIGYGDYKSEAHDLVNVLKYICI